jgi:hypothetical protein
MATDQHALAAAGDTWVEDDLGDEDIPLPASYAITSYGADYHVGDLVDQLKREHLYVPSFERNYVWSMDDASRFVESLLLGLPVPGIFLWKEPNEEKLFILDGQQRLKSLQFFYEGLFRPTQQAFALQGVQDRFEGQTYDQLRYSDRERLDSSLIHATVIRQDDPPDDHSSIYHIFERLNRGGRSLHEQELRAAIYHGPLSVLLHDLNNVDPWRDVFGAVDVRMRDQELILRFLSFYYYGDQYETPMKGFLNRYMNHNRQLDRQSEEEITATFTQTISAVYRSVGADAFRLHPHRAHALNAAVFDSVMVGLARRLNDGPIHDYEALSDLYERLLADDDYQSSCSRATATPSKVRRRLSLATHAFADLA